MNNTDRVNEILEELKQKREHQKGELSLSANPDDWITANALDNVLMGIEDARQYLQKHLATPPTESVEDAAGQYVEDHGFDEEDRDFAWACYYDGYSDRRHATHPTPESEGVSAKEYFSRQNGGMGPEEASEYGTISPLWAEELMEGYAAQAKREERERMVGVVQSYIDKIESDPQISNQEMWTLRTLRMLQSQLQGGSDE